jgi:hypothetical protein
MSTSFKRRAKHGWCTVYIRPPSTTIVNSNLINFLLLN